MRVEMLVCCVAAAVLFSGTMPGMNGAMTRSHAAEAPAWLPLPDELGTPVIEFSGAPGREQSHGMVVVRTGTATMEGLKTLAVNLAREGFDVHHQSYASGARGNTRSLITAIHPQTGRLASVAINAGVTGGEVRITFSEPGGT